MHDGYSLNIIWLIWIVLKTCNTCKIIKEKEIYINDIEKNYF